MHRGGRRGGEQGGRLLLRDARDAQGGRQCVDPVGQGNGGGLDCHCAEASRRGRTFLSEGLLEPPAQAFDLTEPLPSAQPRVTWSTDTVIIVRRTVGHLRFSGHACRARGRAGGASRSIRRDARRQERQCATRRAGRDARDPRRGDRAGLRRREDRHRRSHPGRRVRPRGHGADWHRDSGDTATTWGGTDFRFRAVGGVYKITIYGSGVDLVASGHGTVILAGSTDTPARDGVFSLNSGDFKSLPATPTKQLTIGVSPATTG